jgi:hypothetical protein
MGSSRITERARIVNRGARKCHDWRFRRAGGAVQTSNRLGVTDNGQVFPSAAHSMTHLQILIAAALAFVVTQGVARAQTTDRPVVAGLVKRVSGSANLDRSGATVLLAAGDTVRAGDVLRTGANSSIGIALTDDTLLTIGANSELVLNTYTFDTTTHDGNLLASVRRGTTAFVTGLIAKKAPENVRVQTRTVVLGVRGTEFIVDAGRGAP